MTDREEAISDLVARRVATAHAHNRERVAQFMLARGFPTGHGDTIDDLLMELGGELARRQLHAVAEMRRLRDAIVSARWRLAKGKGLWNGPATECDMVLENALKATNLDEAIATEGVRGAEVAAAMQDVAKRGIIKGGDNG